MVRPQASAPEQPGAGSDPSSAKMVRGGVGQPEAEVVRLRVSTGGKFVMTEQAVWKYVGGDTFMQTVPVAWKYAELMFSLAEKVDGAVSVKYQLPGEELDPDSLISVSDDSDLQELFDEYVRALRLPGTPVKTFRLRIFLFRAAEDPLTPEDIVGTDRYLSSRASSADKFAKESAFSKALSKATATNSYASNYSSGSSSANVMSQSGGLAAAETETELAWEAGFRAGQEAMAIVAAEAAEEEWQQMLARRMVSLARMQSHYMLGEADDAAVWGQGVDYTWAMQHAAEPGGVFSRSMTLHANALAGALAARGSGGSGSQHASLAARATSLAPPAAQLPEGLLGDCPVDMEASLVDVTEGLDGGGAGMGAEPAALGAVAGGGLGGLPAAGGRLTPPTSPSQRRPAAASLPGSRLASPRQQALASPSRRSQLGSPRQAQLGTLGSPRPLLPALHEQQPPGDGLFPPAAPRVQLFPQLLAQGGAPSQVGSPLQPGDLEDQPSVHMVDVPSAEFENMFESKYAVPPLDGVGGFSDAAERSASGPSQLAPADTAGKESSGARAAGTLSPNSLLPTHISAFGDGVDLTEAAAAVSPVAACLPTHISEFGEDDAEQPLEADPNAMSVMKAALPEEDLDMLTSPASLPVRPAAPAAGVAVAGGAAAAAAAAVKLPPGSLQLPTSFELLASPRASARAVQEAMLAEEALPQQPSSLHRSPSVEELLRKVQCVDARQVRVLAKIGEGAFGEVSLAECPTYGRVAVKWIKPTKVERHWASFWHEAELMSRLNHPNVLRFYGLVVNGPLVVGIMTEFAKNGSLASYIRSGIGFIPLRLRAELALHAVHGMAYLHTQKVVHFDVKPDNLLVDGDFYLGACPVVKVADFGLSKHKYNTFCSNVHDLRGTLPYMAPEMIMDHQHVTEKADVWSLGVVFWEMLTLEVPYQDMPPAQLIGALGLGKLRLPIPEWCEPDWRALMESCWVVDPLLRPSCRQLSAQLERIRDLAP